MHTDGRSEGSKVKDQRSRKWSTDGSDPRRVDPFADAYIFKRLLLWQKAQGVADQIIELVEGLPSNRVTNVLVQQIVKSATSIAANVAEGHARYTVATYRNHLSIARGSAAETISWLDLLKRRKLISEAAEHALLRQLADVLRLITAKMIALEKLPSTKAVRDEQEDYIA